MTPVLVRGMWGLGDNIYQRAIVRTLCADHDVFLETPWPEIYEDLPIKFVRGNRLLRTQTKNISRQPPSRWTAAPIRARQIHIGYDSAALKQGSILAAMERSAGIRADPLIFDLPPCGSSPVASQRPIALVRPVTVRSEWRNDARNPLPEYVAWIAKQLRSTHHVVLVADVAEGQEWTKPPLPPHDTAYLRGELDITRLLALASAADVLVGGVGWIVPAAAALKRRAFIVLGGHGGHNSPERIIDQRMEADRIGFAMPNRFCRCTDMRHRCNKTISDLARQFQIFAERTGLCATKCLPAA